MAFGYGVYFTERTRNRVIRWEPDTGDAEVAAGEPKDLDPEQQFAEPYGLAIDGQGRLLVADKGKNRICSVSKGKVERLNLKDVSGHRRALPTTRVGYDSTLRAPTSLLLEPSGAIVATFSDDYTIYRIQPSGDLELLLGISRNHNYLIGATSDVIPSSKVASTPLAGPTAIARKSDGTLYFVERRRQAVREWKPKGDLKSIFPQEAHYKSSCRRSAEAAGKLLNYAPPYPSALAVDPEGRLCVADLVHRCILVIDQDKEEYRKVVDLGALDKQRPPYGGPAGLTFGRDGIAWILDSGLGRIRGFAPRPSGSWEPIKEALASFQGQAIVPPKGGAGLVTGA